MCGIDWTAIATFLGPVVAAVIALIAARWVLWRRDQRNAYEEFIAAVATWDLAMLAEVSGSEAISTEMLYAVSRAKAKIDLMAPVAVQNAATEVLTIRKVYADTPKLTVDELRAKVDPSLKEFLCQARRDMRIRGGPESAGVTPQTS